MSRSYNRERTPAELAANRLDKVVKEHFPEIQKQIRDQWRNEVLNMEQVRNLNMDDLAIALKLLEEVSQGKPVNFTPEFLKPYLKHVLARSGTTESEEVRITRHGVNIFSYMTKVNRYRSERGQNVQLPAPLELPTYSPVPEEEYSAQNVAVDDDHQDEVAELDDDYEDDD